MEHNLDLVNAVASQVQATLNEAAGIGIKPISAELDDDRIHRIVSAAADTPTISAMHNWLGEAVINTTQSFADEFIRANAEFHYESGLSPKIVRTSTGKCCDWCKERLGTFDYKDARKRDVFRRHKRCRCLVVYDPGTGRKQNVHSRQWIDPFEDVTKQGRKVIGLQVNGVTIREIGQHVYDQMTARNVSIDAIVDAISHPLQIKAVKYDENGRPSFVAVGKKATVAINPEIGKLITTYPTHTKVAKKLMKEDGAK